MLFLRVQRYSKTTSSTDDGTSLMLVNSDEVRRRFNIRRFTYCRYTHHSGQWHYIIVPSVFNNLSWRVFTIKTYPREKIKWNHVLQSPNNRKCIWKIIKLSLLNGNTQLTNWPVRNLPPPYGLFFTNHQIVISSADTSLIERLVLFLGRYYSFSFPTLETQTVLCKYPSTVRFCNHNDGTTTHYTSMQM